MIVLTAGPSSLARLMRRDNPLQPPAPRQVDGPGEPAEPVGAGAED